MNLKNHKEKGFVLVFVIAVVSALSIMTGAMFFYYDNDLKSVSRNSVMQQVNLAAETGLQEGQKWISDQLNSNSFSLVDIQNDFHIEDSDNKCLNRHGFTNSDENVYFAKRIEADLGSDEAKFQDMSYEVFVQRHSDAIRSIYFSAEGSTGGSDQDTTYTDRSFALVENFKDFPTSQFTIEMWIKNTQSTSTYEMHAFEFGRPEDVTFKVKNDKWSPRIAEDTIAATETATVGSPSNTKDKWVHIAWVWEGGTSGTDTDNVKIYQNGVMSASDEYDFDLDAVSGSNYTNQAETLPAGDFWPLAIGEGLAGFSPSNYQTGDVKIQSLPWKGNIAELRIWNIARSATDISNNYRKRLSGSEPGLVSYYKFNEGSGNIAKDSNTSRGADRKNDATIYGIGNKGTLWKTEFVDYEVTSETDTAPTLNVPPAEDLVYYKILSCGKGPQNQIVPLELIVSAPLQKGDVGDGKIALTSEDLNDLTGQEGTPLITPLSTYVGQLGTDGDINIQTKDNTNTNFYVYKRAMEQCNNTTTFTDFSASSSYNEGDCVEYNDKLYYLEKDDGKSANADFEEDDWSEVLGSGCDGVQFKSSSGDNSYGHYYKYFSTAPNISSDLGYNGDSIDWWEAKRRAEQSTCGGMRGYLVSIESAAENEFIKDAVMCDNSTDSGCTGVTPFHVAAGETRAVYYGARLDGSDDEHYLWLSNSDWRDPTLGATNMQSESGPLMGMSVSYTNWQTNEPNNAAEPYADMEINRDSRTDGGWNDLRRIPNCNSGGLDCITGYVVEYGGYDHFSLEHDINQDGDTDDADEVNYSDTNFCMARVTIEADTYVAAIDGNLDGDLNDLDADDNPDIYEDILQIDTNAEDYPSAITADNTSASDNNTSDDYLGWNAYTGVLTLVHSGKPDDWSPATSYNANDFVWYNNRVWKNTSGSTITGGSSLDISETPTNFNPQVWTLYSGNESDAPCDDIDVWEQAFESVKYYNTLEPDAEDGDNPYAVEGTDGTDGTDPDADDVTTPSLGERTILFSLGPLHVNEHRDGYNHFYEFYEFPRRASSNANNDIFNDKNRRMNEGFSLARQLDYFGKSGYLATITSEEENDIVTDKAVGNGWMGGISSSDDQNSNADLNKCGGFRQRDNRAEATADFRALRDFENITMYRGGQSYGSSVNYLRNIVEKYRGTVSAITISSISKANPALVTTSSNHGLVHDDIIKIADISSSNQMNVDGMTQLSTGFYRVRVVSNTTFNLVDLDTRENINSTSFSNYTASTAQLWELEGIQNEFYRKETATISSSNNNPQSQSGIELFYKDPKIALETNAAITGNRTRTFFNASLSNVDDSVDNDECPFWRWVTGPEGMLWNGRGLAFAPNRTASEDPSANQEEITLPKSGQPNRGEPDWTRANPSGQQIGEIFVDGMPFRNWSGEDEPNNVAGTEHGVHMLGTHFSESQQLTWNDLHNWNNGPDDSYSNYSIRGIIVEYGGMENDEDPIIRIATKRVIKLYDRRVSKAIVKIKTGAQSGDKLVAGTNELSALGLSATNNETATVTLTGDATCKNYLDLIKSMYFEHNASTAGTREIEVLIGDVKKPTDAEHYYQLNIKELNYNQANFQATYANLCGIQGYLANVTTTADLDALKELGVSNNKEAWVNGTDECQGGLYRSGFWRYTSGPWKDKEFWRVRINTSLTDADLENEASCNQTTLRSSESSVRVGPFASANWMSSHPAADDNDYLTFKQTSSSSTTKIMTREGAASSDVEGYIVRFGGSVGDYTGAVIEEDDNNIAVVLGPVRAEVSFYNDGSENSIFISDEDTVKINTTGDNALTSGWSRSATFIGSSNSPLKITPPANTVPTIEEWRDELEKVYYQNTDTSDFTPGNRRIKVKLVYGDTTLNQEVGIVKAIGSRNAVTVTPISWNNR